MSTLCDKFLHVSMHYSVCIKFKVHKSARIECDKHTLPENIVKGYARPLSICTLSTCAVDLAHAT